MQLSKPELIAQEHVVGMLDVKVFRQYPAKNSHDLPAFKDDRAKRIYLRELRKEMGGLLLNELTSLLSKLIKLSTISAENLSPEDVVIRRIARIKAIKQMYLVTISSHKMMHEYNPRMLIGMYRGAITLKNQVDRLLIDPFYQETLDEMVSVRRTLTESIECVRNFWVNEHPRFLFTMPTDLAMPILLEKVADIMVIPSCLEIVMGTRPITDWIDTAIARWINACRQEYVVKKKTNVLGICLGVAGIPVEICSLIASYICVEKESIEPPMILAEFIRTELVEGRIEMVMTNGAYSQHIYITPTD